MATVDNYADSTETINDLEWLPTEWEMFQNGKDSFNNGVTSVRAETAVNQTWLEYYSTSP
jgi:hypothetical protein